MKILTLFYDYYNTISVLKIVPYLLTVFTTKTIGSLHGTDNIYLCLRNYIWYFLDLSYKFHIKIQLIRSDCCRKELFWDSSNGSFSSKNVWIKLWHSIVVAKKLTEMHVPDFCLEKESDFRNLYFSYLASYRIIASACKIQLNLSLDLYLISTRKYHLIWLNHYSREKWSEPLLFDCKKIAVFRATKQCL